MKALIFKNPKNPMQSGTAKTHEWVLEATQELDSRFVEGMMGWTGSSDMTQELVLTFESEAEAVAYAEREGFDYEVIKSRVKKLKIRTYADNFKFNKPAA